jgi:hypothetical protein
MLPLLAKIFIGWPAIIGSLLVSLLGIYGRRPHQCIAGAILSLGFAWCLTALPVIIFKLAGYSIPLFHLAAMFYVRQGRERIAGLFLLPHAAIALYFLLLLIAQYHSIKY